MRKLTLQALTALALLAPLAACHEPGPAERAGRSIDNAGSAIRDAVDPPSGPAERAGRSIDRATR
jgi:predicted small secreted protein